MHPWIPSLLLMPVNAYLSSQAISQKDLDPQNIDWSKVSSNVVSRVSDALTEARQLVYVLCLVIITPSLTQFNTQQSGRGPERHRHTER